jgi:hypothetical protein
MGRLSEGYRQEFLYWGGVISLTSASIFHSYCPSGGTPPEPAGRRPTLHGKALPRLDAGENCGKALQTCISLHRPKRGLEFSGLFDGIKAFFILEFRFAILDWEQGDRR